MSFVFWAPGGRQGEGAGNRGNKGAQRPQEKQPLDNRYLNGKMFPARFFYDPIRYLDNACFYGKMSSTKSFDEKTFGQHTFLKASKWRTWASKGSPAFLKQHVVMTTRFKIYDLRTRLFMEDSAGNRFVHTSLGVEHLEVDKRPALRSHDLKAHFFNKCFCERRLSRAQF